ncbi:MAG: hypothetical protein ACI957_003700, partial [Verrucomicrobiales bacterium]
AKPPRDWAKPTPKHEKSFLHRCKGAVVLLFAEDAYEETRIRSIVRMLRRSVENGFISDDLILIQFLERIPATEQLTEAMVIAAAQEVL